MSTIKRMEISRRMSKIVVHNNTIYLCGQVAKDGSLPIIGQAESMLARVDALLEQAGSDRKHILSATVYLKNIQDFEEINRVWDQWIPEGHAPARACVEAKIAREDLLVEISVTAVLKE
ncbi:MAG: RidA family protein [Desulfobacteraceae bacterium]|nr:RidA family protein [Desulfobacteraceae bacterium]